MNGDVNQVAGSKRAAKRRMSSVSNEDSGEGTKRPANGFTMSIDERNEMRMKEKKGEVDYRLQLFSNRSSNFCQPCYAVQFIFSSKCCVREGH